MILSQRALNRALLAGQHLLERSSMPAPAMVDHLVGMQAQEPPAPYIGLWSRLAGFDPETISAGLEDRTLVRGTMMRATLHLVSRGDYLAIRPQLQPLIRSRVWSGLRRGLVGVDLDELAAAAAELYGREPLIAREVGRRLSERWPDADVPSLGYASGLTPLVQVPPRGMWGRTGRALLTTTEAWLGEPLPPAPPADELVRRYLRAFGPASVADMRMWSGMGGLREVFERLRPELRTFADERGRELFDVPDGLLPDPDTPVPPRFLPDFENALLAHDDRTRIIDDEHRRLVVEGARFFLVDGVVGGRWRAEGKGPQATVVLEPSARLRAADRRALEAEAKRLQAFLRTA